MTYEGNLLQIVGSIVLLTFPRFVDDERRSREAERKGAGGSEQAIVGKGGCPEAELDKEGADYLGAGSQVT